MHGLILELEQTYKKPQVVVVKSGDTVKVVQRIKEGAKERLQVFEGLVIRVSRPQSLTYRILVRKITSGIGVEKSFLLHSPNVVKVEILKRAKVRRNYLTYMRQRIGKAARLKAVDFNKSAVNQVNQIPLTTDKVDSKDLDNASQAKQSATDQAQVEMAKIEAKTMSDRSSETTKAVKPLDTDKAILEDK